MTIKDLAKHCGLSPAAVSYALNDSPEVSEETKELVRKAAIELNYYPSNLARGLKQNKTNCIGVFIPGYEGSVHPMILSGLANAFTKCGKYQMITTIAGGNLSLIRTKMVDLAIVMDANISDEDVISLSKIVPIITFDKNISGDNIYSTFIKNSKKIEELVSNLILSGIKKPAFMLGSPASHHNVERYEGFVSGIKKNGLDLNDLKIFDAGAFTEDAGYETMASYLKQAKTDLAFDAVICANDELAIGVVKALSEFNIKIPDIVSVTGFDNIAKGSLISPKLSTIAVDWRSFGESLGEYAFKILERKHDEKIESLVFDCKIIKRESSK